jgi:hypothetical protein
MLFSESAESEFKIVEVKRCLRLKKLRMTSNFLVNSKKMAANLKNVRKTAVPKF